MTQALSKAFEAASDLPEDAQQLLAEQLMEEIEGELLWDEILANNPDQLERMADQALQEFLSNPSSSAMRRAACRINAGFYLVAMRALLIRR